MCYMLAIVSVLVGAGWRDGVTAQLNVPGTIIDIMLLLVDIWFLIGYIFRNQLAWS